MGHPVCAARLCDTLIDDLLAVEGLCGSSIRIRFLQRTEKCAAKKRRIMWFDSLMLQRFCPMKIDHISGMASYQDTFTNWTSILYLEKLTLHPGRPYKRDLLYQSEDDSEALSTKMMTKMMMMILIRTMGKGWEGRRRTKPICFKGSL